MGVGLVRGIAHEIFELGNILSGNETFLRTLSRCRGIKWEIQFDTGDMWSATSPSHRNRRRNCDLGVTSKGGCEIIQHSPGNFRGFSPAHGASLHVCNEAGGRHFENSRDLMENNSIKKSTFLLSTLLGDAVNRQKMKKINWERVTCVGVENCYRDRLRQINFFFDVLLAVYLRIFISVINQLDAQNFCFTISLFHASKCFEHMSSYSGG